MPSPSWNKTASDLANAIAGMTFDELTTVAQALVDIYEDGGYDIESNLSVAELLNNWAQTQREG